MEWSNKFSSFNSWKGLTYHENYNQIAGWLENKLPPPIECNLDPIAECNLNCYFCITQRYLRANRDEVGEMRKLPFDYMMRLVDFIVGWGVKGLCISGGGEPSLHEDIEKVITYASGKMDVAFVTNAVHIRESLVHALQHCRWVALSVDSANRETYKTIKGKDKFGAVIGNIRRLTSIRTKADFCFKFLIVPENQYEIYDACKLAKSLGVQDFHARPVDFERSDIKGAKKLDLDIKEILNQFEKCHELESEDFHVYTVTHKFNPEFHVKYDYDKCLAAPLIIPILTNGIGYLCVEHKMEVKYSLGQCYPDPKDILNWWGNDRHRQMIKDIIPQRDCSRCIYSEYHKQIEAITQDRMCRNFP